MPVCEMVVHLPYYLPPGEELDPGSLPEAFVVMPRRDMLNRFTDMDRDTSPYAIDDEEFDEDFLPETTKPMPGDEGNLVEGVDPNDLKDFDDDFDEDFTPEEEDEYGLDAMQNDGAENAPERDRDEDDFDEEFDDE